MEYVYACSEIIFIQHTCRADNLGETQFCSEPCCLTPIKFDFIQSSINFFSRGYELYNIYVVVHEQSDSEKKFSQ